MKLDRLLYIIIVLLNKNQITAAELAEHFEVSVRTIYRDIETLNMAGIPIYSHQGSGGGFSILDSYKLDKHLLKKDEISSIITALKGMSTTVYDIKLDIIIEKMKTLINSSEEKIDKEIILDFTPWGCNLKQKEKLSKIKRAIEQNKVISFNYTNISGINTERLAEPANLIFKGYSWYLYAYCKVRKSFRIFRLSRIINLKVLEEKYELKDIPSLQINDLGTRQGNTVNFTMKFSPNIRAKVQDYFEEDQIEFMENGYMKVEIVYPEDEWLYGFILSFGAEAEVLIPQYLRDIIKRKSREIYDKYNL